MIGNLLNHLNFSEEEKDKFEDLFYSIFDWFMLFSIDEYVTLTISVACLTPYLK